MFIPVQELELFYPLLFSRYLAGDEEVCSLYSGDYGRRDSFEKRITFLKEKSFPARASLLQEMNRPFFKGKYARMVPGKEQENNSLENNSLDNNSLENNSLEKAKGEGINDDDVELYVITGQQPALLTGPLYTVYKGLTAVKLAEKLKKTLGVCVKPLFWVASEDHNIHDLIRVFVPGKNQGNPVKIRIPVPRFGPPAGSVNLQEKDMEKVLQNLDNHTPASPYKEEVISLLREKTSISNNFAHWFMHLLSLLFSEQGLLFIDPLHLSRSGLYISLLRQVVEEGPLIHHRLSLGEQRMASLGLPLQVERKGQEALLMVAWQGRRYTLFREGNTFFSGKGEVSFTRQELISLMETDPGLFSPNVLLRPVFQDYLFPNLAYLPGPGELAYFAQIRDVYELFGLKMPLLFPRTGVTIVEPEPGILMGKENIQLTDVVACAREEEMGRVYPFTASFAYKALKENLWPRNRPQERVFHLFYYLMRYGFPFWEAFSRHFPLNGGHFQYFWDLPR